MPDGDHPLDRETVAELRQLDSDSPGTSFLAQLVLMFQTNAPERMAQIRAAVAERQGETLGHVAHTLKSNCSMLGALRMADYCQSFETMGERREFESAAALLPAAEEEFATVVNAVSKLAPRSPSEYSATGS
jgi:HPt (histidine-containing phosphotransfer) domain-containing protein